MAKDRRSSRARAASCIERIRHEIPPPGTLDRPSMLPARAWAGFFLVALTRLAAVKPHWVELVADEFRNFNMTYLFSRNDRSFVRGRWFAEAFDYLERRPIGRGQVKPRGERSPQAYLMKHREMLKAAQAFVKRQRKQSELSDPALRHALRDLLDLFSDAISGATYLSRVRASGFLGTSGHGRALLDLGEAREMAATFGWGAAVTDDMVMAARARRPSNLADAMLKSVYGIERKKLSDRASMNPLELWRGYVAPRQRPPGGPARPLPPPGKKTS